MRTTPVQPAVERIVRSARRLLLQDGYLRLTMDGLATELGVSKKTLYLHFPSKEALARAILLDVAREIRCQADEILDNHELEFAEKLRRLITGMIARLSQLSPALFRDLQRSAPELHELVLSLRRRNLPEIFGRLLEEGQRRGKVRRGLDTRFASEFLLHAMQGLMQADALDHLHLAPGQVFENAMSIFFSGLLTSAGRTEYERTIAR